MNHYDKWKAWNKERERYRELESAGYSEDIKRLENHIKVLLEVCPKDEAGWPRTQALDVINFLRRDLDRAKAFFGKMS